MAERTRTRKRNTPVISDYERYHFNIHYCYTDKYSYLAKESNNVHGIPYPDSFSLPTEEDLVIAFDQSTSQTGLAIWNVQGDLICVADFVNSGKVLDFPIYTGMLSNIMKKILEDCFVEQFIYEKHSRMPGLADSVLMKMKGTMDMWKFNIPALEGLDYGEILPQVWRKHFLRGDPRYKGRYTKDKVKGAAYEECCLRYPELKKYFDSFRQVPDSCDALGIGEGFIQENWEGGWKRTLRKVNTTIEKELVHKFEYKLVHLKGALTSKEVLIKSIKETLTSMSLPKDDVKFYKYLSNKSNKENARIVTSEHKGVSIITLSEKEDIIASLWELNLDYNPLDCIILIAWRV